MSYLEKRYVSALDLPEQPILHSRNIQRQRLRQSGKHVRFGRRGRDQVGDHVARQLSFLIVLRFECHTRL
jgi:hypothetical protein